ncbi:MAG TPA: CHASE2 domain-containing protein [bacterium]|nr:CHASE2 domain-containing protein [bacterium]
MLAKLFRMSGLKLSLFVTLIMLVVFMFGVTAPQSNFINLLDKKWVDFIIKNRPVQPHTDVVAIATIDSKSVDKYGRWPWPRSRMADLVAALNDYYKVGTIGFDIVFSEPEHDTGISVIDKYKDLFASLGFPRSARTNRFMEMLDKTKTELDGDAQFGSELAKRKDSVLGYFFFGDQDYVSQLTKAQIADSASRIAGSEISLLKGTIARGAIPVGLAPESNIEKIYKGGLYSGFFNMYPDPEDGEVRRVHLLMQYGESVYPSLDLQILRQYLHANNIVVEADENGLIFGVTVGQKFIKTNDDGSILLNYKGPQGTFSSYSIYDIIEHNIPKDKLQGKIVLVGATEIGIYDLRNTPVSTAFPGVEVHATLLDNLLTDSYFKLDLMNQIYSALLVVVFGLLLGIVLPNIKPMYSHLLTLGLLVGYFFVQRWMVTNLLSWTSFMYPAMTIFFVWAAVTIYRFLVTDKDKRFIRGAFQQYLSPQVINQLMDNPQLLTLGGERRVMTAFFSDVQGFSTISEKLDPGDLVKLLNVYLTDMSDIITELEGTIDKYEGDAIIAFFGAPVPYEDHAKRACVATLRMQKRLAEMREAWEQEGTPPLYMRIGLNTGPMVVGNMGSEKRFDYTMMGNSVNLAARLEGANKNYGSYSCISEYTYEPAKDDIEVRELDLIRVIGINTPVRIYELLALKGELPEEMQKGIAYFAKGLELYRQQQWEEAAKYFNAVFKFIPDDPPSTKFIERCREFYKNPPGEDWDGVFVAASK